MLPKAGFSASRTCAKPSARQISVNTPSGLSRSSRGFDPARQRVGCCRVREAAAGIGRGMARIVERRVHQHPVDARGTKPGRGKSAGRGHVERDRPHPIGKPVAFGVAGGKRAQRCIDFNQGDGEPVNAGSQSKPGGAHARAEIDRVLARQERSSRQRGEWRRGRRDGRATAGEAAAGRQARRRRWFRALRAQRPSARSSWPRPASCSTCRARGA